MKAKRKIHFVGPNWGEAACGRGLFWKSALLLRVVILRRTNRWAKVTCIKCQQDRVNVRLRRGKHAA